jgi:DNA-binding transcriptional MerR regulator
VSDEPAALRIRDVVERSGIGEATLRAWEQRHGFPTPQRLPSGHRRYHERDIEVLREVAALRDAGMSVPAAIERALEHRASESRSVFAALRRARPDLPVNVMEKRALVPISHAMEDEILRGGEDLLLVGAFQRERHYRDSESRWREMARGADGAVVFADFRRLRRPAAGPVEVPIRVGDPLAREWVLVCDSAEGAACLVAWEPPGQEGVPDRRRRFEAMWTTDRATARAVGRVCCELGPADLPPALARFGESGDRPSDARRTEALTGRIVAYLAQTR